MGSLSSLHGCATLRALRSTCHRPSVMHGARMPVCADRQAASATTYNCHHGPDDKTTPEAMAAAKDAAPRSRIAQGKSIKCGCKARFIIFVHKDSTEPATVRYTTRDHTGHDPETDSTAYLSKAAREFITIQLCQDINMKTSKVAQLWLELQLASYRAAHPDKTDDDILAFFEAEARLVAHVPALLPFRPPANEGSLPALSSAPAQHEQSRARLLCLRLSLPNTPPTHAALHPPGPCTPCRPTGRRPARPPSARLPFILRCWAGQGATGPVLGRQGRGQHPTEASTTAAQSARQRGRVLE